MAQTWAERCADVFAQQWSSVLGRAPTRNGVLNAMSVSQHETSLGRGWLVNGRAIDTFNMGAIQLRRPTSGERGLPRGEFVDGGFIWGDSSPATGGYVCVFRRYSSLDEGIADFIRVLVKSRPGVDRVIDSGAPYDVALAQYLSGYYEGIHRGARLVGKRTLPLNEGEALNVHDYTLACERSRGALEALLVIWGREFEVVTEPFDGGPAKLQEDGRAAAGMYIDLAAGEDDDDTQPGVT